MVTQSLRQSQTVVLQVLEAINDRFISCLWWVTTP